MVYLGNSGRARELQGWGGWVCTVFHCAPGPSMGLGTYQVNEGTKFHRIVTAGGLLCAWEGQERVSEQRELFGLSLEDGVE